MRTSNAIEQEINKIRLAIFEKTKGYTPEELNDYYQKSGEKTAKKYGFKIVPNAYEAEKV